MKINGYTVKENPALTYRFSTKDDIDLEGNTIPEGYPVFIYLKDCEIKNDSKRVFYDTFSADPIPIIYLDNYYGMGTFKTRNSINGIYIDGKLVYEYNQATLYFAYNGKVYTGSLRTLPKY